MTQILRDFAMQELDKFTDEEGHGPLPDRDQAVERWMYMLVRTGGIPDDLLEALPEVSRHNSPQASPQEYECGCVTVTRVTDRDYRYKEEPFEMRLAIPCKGSTCRLARLRAKE